MQDRYVGDVGDFGKYALLNALAGDTLPLGVVWCLNPSPERNHDGRFTDYSQLECWDPNLFAVLRHLVVNGKRLTSEIKHSGVLQRASSFFREPVPIPSRPCCTAVRQQEQIKTREDWFDRAQKTVCDAQLVFLDPDNGVADSALDARAPFTRCKKYQTKSAKYVFRDEIRVLTAANKSVVVYQHQQRKRNQVLIQLAEFAKECQGCFALEFRAISARFYYVLPAQAHYDVLMRRATEFSSGVWKRCFRLQCR
jgi:hypothetical protein